MGKAPITTDIFKGIAVAAAQDYVSDPFASLNGSLWSMHFIWDGTPTGTLALFQSNVQDPKKDKTSTNWVPVPDAEVTFTGKTPAGSEDASFVQIHNSAALMYMVVYTHTGGSGTLQCLTNVSRDS